MSVPITGRMYRTQLTSRSLSHMTRDTATKHPHFHHPIPTSPPPKSHTQLNTQNSSHANHPSPPNLHQRLPRLRQTNNIHPPTTTPPRLSRPPQPRPHRPRRKAHLPPQRALQSPAPGIPPAASEAHKRGSGTAGEGDYFHGQSE